VTIEPELTADLLRARLAGTHLADDPLDIVMPPGSHLWPTEMRAQLADTLKPAGVLIPVMQRREGLALLLTQRSAELTHHAGQVSFPGGRMEEADPDVRAAALREAHEEVGLDPSAPTVVGELAHLNTIVSRSYIVPIVSVVDERHELSPLTGEVDRVFWTPIRDLTRSGTYRMERWGSPPMDRPLHFFELDDETVWGATAHMLVDLLTYSSRR